MVGVAQLVSAPDCGSGGRGFESLHPPHFSSPRAAKSCIIRFRCDGPLAQLAEQGTLNPKVRGSNPRRSTIKMQGHGHFARDLSFSNHQFWTYSGQSKQCFDKPNQFYDGTLIASITVISVIAVTAVTCFPAVENETKRREDTSREGA